MVWNESKPYWSSGILDTRHGIFRALGKYESVLGLVVNVTKSYISYSVRDGIMFHMVITEWGQLDASYNTMQLQRIVNSQPVLGKIYGLCGSFGICVEDTSCKCVPSFHPRNNWTNSSYGVYTGGCERNIKLECGNPKDTFIPLHNMELASDPTESFNTSTCASTCRADCSCQGYAIDGNKCLMWTKDVLNLHQLDANKSEGCTFYLRVAASNEGKDLGRRKHPQLPTLVAIVVSSTVAGAALFIGLYLYLSSRRRNRRAQREEEHRMEIFGGGIIGGEDDGDQMFDLRLSEIVVATNNFSDENKLGEGGFGSVYKGKLANGMDVAIKRLSPNSRQGLLEFRSEIVLILKLQHKNLVRLLGYCFEGGEMLLVYEFMSNKSLDSFLFDSVKCRELNWAKRMAIVHGTARGLQYLHEDSRRKIIHRDLKAANILLDDEKNPKIADFETARTFPRTQINDNTERIVGTYGYMSPEYRLTGIISEKSDIYSFGVLLLEIVSGKKATGFVRYNLENTIVSYAWRSWCDTNGADIVDERLDGFYSSTELIRCVNIALLCLEDRYEDRPTISEIIHMPASDNLLPSPKEPTYTYVSPGGIQRLSSSNHIFSINNISQTTLQGR